MIPKNEGERSGGIRKQKIANEPKKVFSNCSTSPYSVANSIFWLQITQNLKFSQRKRDIEQLLIKTKKSLIFLIIPDSSEQSRQPNPKISRSDSFASNDTTHAPPDNQPDFQANRPLCN